MKKITKAIIESFEQRLSQSGMMFRIFGRAKTVHSLANKMEIKGEKYRNGAKIQDVIGIRIVLYFPEDVEATALYLSDQRAVDHSVDSLDVCTFRPQRLNIVRRLPEEMIPDFRKALPAEYAPYIDDTYEVQVRTVFSEGWHEVEHDLRYKCKEDWEDCDSYSRNLNGVLASLETAQWTMGAIFHEMATKNMQSGNYKAMLRNQLLLRMANNELSPVLTEFLDTHKDVLSLVCQTDRLIFILTLLTHTKPMPLTYDNVLFLINRIDIMNEDLMKLETPSFRQAFEEFRNS